MLRRFSVSSFDTWQSARPEDPEDSQGSGHRPGKLPPQLQAGRKTTKKTINKDNIPTIYKNIEIEMI